MNKLKEIFYKLKNTEIKFKKPNLKKMQNKISSIKDGKSVSLKDIKNINIKEFYTIYKQQILATFVVIMGIFFLFYWTGSLISSSITSKKNTSLATYDRLEKAANMAAKIKSAEKNSARELEQSLLTFIQSVGASVKISNKIVNIRPINSSKGIEHVSLRLENLYYDEFINFIAQVEAYNNISIKSLNFIRRYDNPNKIDVSLEIVKI